jgi:flavin reductase (DIM6/NTAB) family NADH-FMN oxidoreductase RutF
MISITFGNRDGRNKNTLNNITANKEFSVNVVPRSLAEIANESASGTEIGDDFARLGLSSRSFKDSTAVGIVESPASIACEVCRIIEIEEAKNSLVIAYCRELFVTEEYLTDDIFDPLKANVVGSIGAEAYLSAKGEAFSLPRTWD